MHTKIRAEGSAAQTTIEFVRTRPTWQKVAVVASPLALVAAWFALSGSDGPPPAPPMATVTVAQPIERQVNQWDEYVGRFEASRSVEVRPRVSGQIVGVHFTDGEIVHKGQLLFTLDPRPFAAALAEARAGVATAQSELSLAQLNLGRARRLLADEAVSQASVDQLSAQVRSAQAALAAAQARVRQRSLDLEFSQIRAPISGRVSDRRIDAGNLVGAGDNNGTLLTTINSLDPIYFDFNASEALFLKARRAREKGAEPSAVDIRLQDEPDYRWHGRLDFVDNGLDRRSGTIRLRAVVTNPAQFLTPGMFGNMRLASGGPVQAILIPDSAVSTDQSSKVVMVVAKDGTVTPTPVVLGPLVDGLRVIRSGLTTKDRIIISGTQLAMPGVKVAQKIGRIQPDASVNAAATPVAPLAGEATLAGR